MREIGGESNKILNERDGKWREGKMNLAFNMWHV